MAGKVLAGAAGLAGALALIAVLVDPGTVADTPPALQIGGAALGVAMFVGGIMIGIDGVTDILAARRVKRLMPQKTILLSAQGLRFTSAFHGQVLEISVPWDEVEGCAFRPGLGGNEFLCFDVPGRRPTPPAPGESAQEQMMRVDLYAFGTPFTVNLAKCPDVDTAHLDRELRRWTNGRCYLPPR